MEYWYALRNELQSRVPNVPARHSASSGREERAMSDIDIMRTLHLERIEEQKAEIERLRAERDDWHKVADIRSAEIERLRGACTFDKDGLPLTVCSRLADTLAMLAEAERLLRAWQHDGGWQVLDARDAFLADQETGNE